MVPSTAPQATVQLLPHATRYFMWRRYLPADVRCGFADVRRWFAICGSIILAAAAQPYWPANAWPFLLTVLLTVLLTALLTVLLFGERGCCNLRCVLRGCWLEALRKP